MNNMNIQKLSECLVWLHIFFPCISSRVGDHWLNKKFFECNNERVELASTSELDAQRLSARLTMCARHMHVCVHMCVSHMCICVCACVPDWSRALGAQTHPWSVNSKAYKVYAKGTLWERKLLSTYFTKDIVTMESHWVLRCIPSTRVVVWR